VLSGCKNSFFNFLSKKYFTILHFSNSIFAKDFKNMNHLVLDLGNTALKAACFQERTMLKSISASWSNADEIEEALLRLMVYNPSHVFISSVAGKRKEVELFLKRAQLKATFLDAETAIPIRNQYQTPETLGADRLANAVAAASIFPNKPCVIIDSGTCIKFDFITRNNEYFGGSISPGIEMRFKALHEFTHQLPLLTQTEPVYLIGKNTNESIHSGVINGTLAEVKGILEQYQMTHKDLQVILTGGDYALIERTIKTSVHVEPWLTLKGLNEIFLHQSR
jgi:type III pantothenate kinase